MGMEKSFSMFPDKGRWYKGNLHCHTTLSDGTLSPEEMVQSYRTAGYDFLCLSDHERLLKHDVLSDEGFLILNGTELGVSRDGHGNQADERYYGLLAIEDNEYPAEEFIYPIPCADTSDTCSRMRRQQFDFVKSKRMFTFFHHPAFGNVLPEELDDLPDVEGMELFNSVVLYQCGSCVSSVPFWDRMLLKGRRVLGLSTDDNHQPDKGGKFTAWITVKAADLTASGILSAIRDRNYYSTTGPEIYNFGIRNGIAYVDCSPVQEIRFIAYWDGVHMESEESALTHGEYELKGFETYLRAEIIDHFGKCAWTNAFYKDELYI